MIININSYETGWDKLIEFNNTDNKFLNKNDIYVSFHAPALLKFQCAESGLLSFTPMAKVGASLNFSVFYKHNDKQIKCEILNTISLHVNKNDIIEIIATCVNNYKSWAYIVFHDVKIKKQNISNNIFFKKHNHLGDSLSVIYGLERLGIENNCIFNINGCSVMKEIINLFNINHVKFVDTISNDFINGDDIFSLCSWHHGWLERFYKAYNSFFNIHTEINSKLINQNDIFSLKRSFNTIKKSGVLIQFDSRSESRLSDMEIHKIIKWCSKPVSIIGGPDTKKYLGEKFNYLIGNLEKNIHDLLSCEIFIGSDSGMAHLAGILNVPSIVVAVRDSTYIFHNYKKTAVVGIDFFGSESKNIKYNPDKIKNIFYGVDENIVDVTNIIINNNIYENNNTYIDKLLGYDILNGKYKNLYIKWKNGDVSSIKHGDIIKPENEQKNCIYFTPVGNEYREMCSYAVKSIVNSEKYDGKIIIFCDEVDENIKSVEKYCDIVTMNFDCHPLVNRIYALEMVSSLYKSILYLDCDVIAYGDINNLFCYDDLVMYMEEPWHYNKNTVSGLIDTYYFTDEEKNITYGNYHPINSGHFSTSGKYKDEFLAIYKSKYESRKTFSWGQDQSCLNYIVRTGMVKSKAYDHNIIGISTHLNPSEYDKYDLIHFAGHGGRLDIMRNICSKM